MPNPVFLVHFGYRILGIKCINKPKNGSQGVLSFAAKQVKGVHCVLALEQALQECGQSTKPRV